MFWPDPGRWIEEMYILELLGFQGLLYVFLLVTFLVIRYMWRNAEVRKEEIIRLVDMASQEAAFVEMEASVESSFVPASRGHQCAVCYSPTTMRCSKCKAVRYWFVLFTKVSHFQF